jgi:hypothetical protein
MEAPRHLWHALTGLCLAGVGLNAWAEPHGYPVLQQWFGSHADDVGRTSFVLFTLGAGFFGYLSGIEDKAPKSD